jgi:hypothetical protein
MRARAVAFAGLLLAASAAGQAAAQSQASEGLGRVFFTPAQRQELDRRRQLNIQEAVVTNESRFTLNGQVTRSSGKTTTWVNGMPQHDAYKPGNAATVPILTGENDPSVSLKVGQTVDKVRGEVSDGLAGGQVKVQPRGAKPR